MPVYNAQRTVLESVNSVLSQSHLALELIVCDDASSDGTRALLESISDPRFHLLVNDRNLGQGPSRDRAIAVATAQWIAFIDADDVWVPDRLQSMLVALGDDDNALVFDDLMTCHDTPSGLVPWKRLRGEDAFGEDSPAPRYVAPRDFVVADRLLIKPIVPAAPIHAHGLKHSGRKFGEDAEFFLRIASHGTRMIYVPAPLYLYRVSPGSLTASAGNMSAMRECLEDCAKFPGFGPDEKTAFAVKIANLADNEVVHAAAQFLTRGRILAALNLLVRNPRAMRQFPQRVVRRLGYELHRITYGGRTR